MSDPTELDLIIAEVSDLRASMRETLFGKLKRGKVPPQMLRYAATLARIAEVEARLLKLKGPVQQSRHDLALAELWAIMLKVLPELATLEAQEKIYAAIRGEPMPIPEPIGDSSHKEPPPGAAARPTAAPPPSDSRPPAGDHEEDLA